MESTERLNGPKSAVYAVLGLRPHDPARDDPSTLLQPAEIKARAESALPRIISLLDEVVSPRTPRQTGRLVGVWPMLRTPTCRTAR